MLPVCHAWALQFHLTGGARRLGRQGEELCESVCKQHLMAVASGGFCQCISPQQAKKQHEDDAPSGLHSASAMSCKSALSEGMVAGG